MSAMFAEVMPGLVPDHAFGAFLALSAFAAVAAVLGVVPIRHGHGQHGDAGPGAVGVWQLYENVATERRDAESRPRYPEPELEPEPDEIIWPEHDWPEGGWSREDQPSGDRPEDDWPERHRRERAWPESEYIGRHRLPHVDVLSFRLPGRIGSATNFPCGA